MLTQTLPSGAGTQSLGHARHCGSVTRGVASRCFACPGLRLCEVECHEETTGCAMAATTKYFEDFQVGEQFHSPATTLTETHFVGFAGLTGDQHPIHYDDAYAKTTRFGQRVAHGLLLTALTAVG